MTQIETLANQTMDDLSILTSFEKDQLLANLIDMTEEHGELSALAMERAIDLAVGTCSEGGWKSAGC